MDVFNLWFCSFGGIYRAFKWKVAPEDILDTSIQRTLCSRQVPVSKVGAKYDRVLPKSIKSLLRQVPRLLLPVLDPLKTPAGSE